MRWVAWLGHALDTPLARILVWVGGLAAVAVLLFGQQATDNRLEQESMMRARAGCVSSIESRALVGALTQIAVASGASDRTPREQENTEAFEEQVMDQLVRRPSPICAEFLDSPGFERRVDDEMNGLLSSLQSDAGTLASQPRH